MGPTLRLLREAVTVMLALAVLSCGCYPLAVWAAAQFLFPETANGTLSLRRGVVVGSDRIAQGFAGPDYLHPRPSAAGKGYDATRSGGSNLGPLSDRLLVAVAQRVAAYREENDLPLWATVPVDAVTTSGSGLDPHISVVNARLQAPRVARLRGLTLAAVDSVIDRCTDGPDLGLFGTAGVNVLAVNLALDAR